MSKRNSVHVRRNPWALENSPIARLADAIRCLDADDRLAALDQFVDLVKQMPSYDPDRASADPSLDYITGDEPGIVYYVRFGERVKIGTTIQLATRLRSIPHDEVLAVEPGGVEMERRRHLQFADYRMKGEWFLYGLTLREHIASLQ